MYGFGVLIVVFGKFVKFGLDVGWVGEWKVYIYIILIC